MPEIAETLPKLGKGKSAKRHKKNCRQCGKEFLAERRHRKYCSDFCRHKFFYPALPPRPKAKCVECGTEIVKKNGRHLYCSPLCGSRAYTDQNRETYNERMRAFHHRQKRETPWKPMIDGAKIRAKKDGLPFDLDYAWGESRWTGFCEISGLPFDLFSGRRNIFSATIDRKTAGGGYTKDNCQIVLWAVNAFKHDGSEADMYRIAEAITKRRPQDRVAVGLLSLPN